MTSVCEKSSPLNSIGRPRDLAENDRTDGRRVYDDHVGSPWASHASGSRARRSTLETTVGFAMWSAIPRQWTFRSSTVHRREALWIARNWSDALAQRLGEAREGRARGSLAHDDVDEREPVAGKGLREGGLEFILSRYAPASSGAEHVDEP